jgi:hypothetical protein
MDLENREELMRTYWKAIDQNYYTVSEDAMDLLKDYFGLDYGEYEETVPSIEHFRKEQVRVLAQGLNEHMVLLFDVKDATNTAMEIEDEEYEPVGKFYLKNHQNEFLTLRSQPHPLRSSLSLVAMVDISQREYASSLNYNNYLFGAEWDIESECKFLVDEHQVI